jgi:hypothetical protein
MSQPDYRDVNLGLPDDATSELPPVEFEKAWDSLSKLLNEATQEPGTQVRPYFLQENL